MYLNTSPAVLQKHAGQKKNKGGKSLGNGHGNGKETHHNDHQGAKPTLNDSSTHQAQAKIQHGCMHRTMLITFACRGLVSSKMKEAKRVGQGQTELNSAMKEGHVKCNTTPSPSLAAFLEITRLSRTLGLTASDGVKPNECTFTPQEPKTTCIAQERVGQKPPNRWKPPANLTSRPFRAHTHKHTAPLPADQHAAYPSCKHDP